MAAQEFRIESDSPVTDDLMFWCIAGHECLGRASAYELRVLSRNASIDAHQVLGHAFDVVIGFDDASGTMHQRHAQGHAVRFARMAKVGRFHQYHITLRSWMALLSKRVNSRIFQEKNVLEVMDAVVDSTAVQRVKKIDKDNVIGTHAPRRYCVQHQERDDAFIARLLEDEGIYYWFDAHDAPGTLHLSDTSSVAHAALPASKVLQQWAQQAGTLPRFNELLYLTAWNQAGSGAYASRDSDFKVISKTLLGDKSDPDTHEMADLEVFEFPGGFLNPDDREDHARVRMEELAARRELYAGRTNWADVAVGKSFEYQGAEVGGAPEGDYLIVGCVFCVRQSGYEGVDGAAQAAVLQRQIEPLMRQHARDNPLFAQYADVQQNWMDADIHEVMEAGTHDNGQGHFAITALRAHVPYRPPRLMRRPTMPGPQSAIVVGPEGEEIFADPFGRVKVQFHWDRYGESDENSTCWVRVSQPWAGKGWGAYFIPRIGQEVIVDFLNGDPDRPVITGRVYNSDQPIPFASHTQSGIKTRSTPGGDTSTFNELRFEDAIGKEQVHLHAEKDLDVLVEKMETRKVGTHRFTKIAGMCQTSVGGKRTADVGGNDVLKVSKQQKITIGGTKEETVRQSTTFTSILDWTAAARNVCFRGVISYQVKSVSITHTATAKHVIHAPTYQLTGTVISVTGTSLTQNTSESQSIKGGNHLGLAAKEVHVSATDVIELKCGASRVKLTPTEILIESPTIKLKGAKEILASATAQVKIDAAVVKINT